MLLNNNDELLQARKGKEGYLYVWQRGVNTLEIGIKSDDIEICSRSEV